MLKMQEHKQKLKGAYRLVEDFHVHKTVLMIIASAGAKTEGSRGSFRAMGNRYISVLHISWSISTSTSYPLCLVTGLYGSAEEAARAYDMKAIELHGECAKTNFDYEMLAQRPKLMAFSPAKVSSPALAYSEPCDPGDIVVLPTRRVFAPPAAARGAGRQQALPANAPHGSAYSSPQPSPRVSLGPVLKDQQSVFLDYPLPRNARRARTVQAFYTLKSRLMDNIKPIPFSGVPFIHAQSSNTVCIATTVAVNADEVPTTVASTGGDLSLDSISCLDLSDFEILGEIFAFDPFDTDFMDAFNVNEVTFDCADSDGFILN